MMKQMKKLLCVLLASAMPLTVLTSCAQKDAAPEESEKFILNVCVCNDIASLDPAMNTDSAAQSVFYALFENLMRFSNDGSGGAKAVPGIAKEYVEETNYDGTVSYRFTIRSSARWSDGEAVTANDFVFAWKRLADPATGSPNHEILEMVQGYDQVRETGNTDYLGVSAKNDTTFVVTLSKPCSYFIEGVCTAVATMPLRADRIEEYPDNWASSAGLITDGAYHVGTWTAGEELQTKRNDEYYEARLVGPDGIRFHFAESSEEAYRLYQSGEVDCVSQLPESVIGELADQQNFYSIPLGKSFCILYNNYTDVFSDGNVRKAFDLVIDRAAVADAAGLTAVSATGLVPYGIPSGTEEEKDFRTVGGELCAIDEETYGERCKLALDSITLAGYYQGSFFPSVEYFYDGGDAAARASALLLTQMWSEKLHITVVPTALTAEELNARIVSGEYDLAGTYLNADYNDAMSFLERFGSDSEGNIVHYSNGTYDILMGVADGSDNLSARAAFLHDAETLLLEDYAVSPVFFGGSCGILRESLHGVYFDSVGRCYLTGVTKSEG